MLSRTRRREARIEGAAPVPTTYLVKPFSARELLARVGSHLGACGAAERARALVALSQASSSRTLLEQVRRSASTWSAPTPVVRAVNPGAAGVRRFRAASSVATSTRSCLIRRTARTPTTSCASSATRWRPASPTSRVRRHRRVPIAASRSTTSGGSAHHAARRRGEARLLFPGHLRARGRAHSRRGES